uniref:Huntingtin n=1 Tax=Ditylenchus dipsaci TaxID=166011 RepID=A0A915ECA2_9BILA
MNCVSIILLGFPDVAFNMVSDGAIPSQIPYRTICFQRFSRCSSRSENVIMHSNNLKQVLDSLYEMVVAITLHTECRENFFSHQTRPAFGHMVSLLLEIFGDYTRDTSIRMNAARILKKTTEVNLKQVSADSLALVLPGFFAKCQRIAIDNVNTTVPYQIPQTAVLLISQIIRSTMCTSVKVEEVVADPESGTDVEKLAALPNFQLQIQRDSKWLEMATSKLLPQLSPLWLCCVSTTLTISVFPL